MKRYLLLVAAAALIILGLVLLFGGGSDDARRPPVADTPAASTSGGVQVSPKDSGDGNAGGLRFDEPKDARNVQVTRDDAAGVDEVRFEIGDLAARVRVQPAVNEDSLQTLMAAYSGQGTVSKATLGATTGMLVVSPSPPYVSQLFASIRGGRIYYSQVLSFKRDTDQARALLMRLHTSLKVAGGRE